ncbi:MAG: pyruvate kinase alpha/beta domain-containing protein [Candidatus Bathyarchaeota archaeon]
MGSVERKTVYFDSAGKHNTDVVLKLAKDYASNAGIEDVVVASTTGETGAKTARMFKGFNVVVVTHHVGFREPGVHELTEEFRQRILKHQAKILTATHALSSVERAIRKRFGTLQPLELVANTLRLLGEGTKVCVEIVVMAADAGLIPVNKDVLAIAGTGRGADTALVVKPANASTFFELRIRETIAKPRSFV